MYAKEAAGRPKSAGLAEAAQQACGDHQRRLCSYAQATEALIDEAIEGALAAKGAWQAMPFADRCAIFLRAADLLTSTSHGYRVMAATMAGQGKNAWQAEIDAYAELADFWRFNCHFAQQIYAEQPLFHASNTWNRMEYRPLDGFVLAISPFNFTAIGGNLPCAPALMGNVVVWKPSASAILSNYLVYRVLLDAGLPPGVIQFVPGPAKAVAGRALAHAQMGGVHFTGSTTVFQGIWQEVGINIGRYASYPRLVGETGGKNFHFVHASADLASVVHNTIRGAFEYQGQKCSATSRLYLPSSMWPAFSRMLTDELAAVGLPRDVCAANGGAIDDDAFGAFCGPVINREAYDRIKGYIDRAREEGRAGSSGRARLFYGGACDDSRGFFIEPTVIVAEEASYETMTEEIFGPVLTVHLYPEGEYAKHVSDLRPLPVVQVPLHHTGRWLTEGMSSSCTSQRTHQAMHSPDLCKMAAICTHGRSFWGMAEVHTIAALCINIASFTLPPPFVHEQVCARSNGLDRGERGPARRSRKLLHQRQEHGCRRRPAGLWRRPPVRHK